MHNLTCNTKNCSNHCALNDMYCTPCRQTRIVAGNEALIRTQNTRASDRATVDTDGELSGGDVNYYLLKIEDPKRLAPYECEAEDIIEALEMTFSEGNVFKALWRSCAMRVRGHGKRGADEHGVYDGDKIAYYGERTKVVRRRKARKLAPSK